MDLRLDVSDLKRFAARCKREVPGLEKELAQAIGLAGPIVERAAKRNASFSKDIPATIKSRRRGMRVRIQAGGDAAPHAAPLENQGQQGSFRHPVFGNFDNWVDQPAHPFLTPALEESDEAVEAVVLRAVDITAARLVS